MKRKILVQHRQTKTYISNGEQHQWTDCAGMARLFETPYHALHFCVEREVKNANVVFCSLDGREVRFLRC
jgi:hypothetical protein